MSTEPTIRPTAPEITERRRLREVARPFIKDVMHWQAQLAFYRHRSTAARSTPSDLADVTAELRKLLRNVEAAQKRFADATSDEPAVGAVDDASRSFARLIESISAELR